MFMLSAGGTSLGAAERRCCDPSLDQEESYVGESRLVELRTERRRNVTGEIRVSDQLPVRMCSCAQKA